MNTAFGVELDKKHSSAVYMVGIAGVSVSSLTAFFLAGGFLAACSFTYLLGFLSAFPAASASLFSLAQRFFWLRQRACGLVRSCQHELCYERNS